MAGEKGEENYAFYNTTEQLNQEILEPFVCDMTTFAFCL
jgi:hypothetical protein